MNFQKSKSKTTAIFILAMASCLLLIAFISHLDNPQENLNSFKSNFEGLDTQTWIGPEYWSNPLQDWQVSNNRIECLVSNENRNIHLLNKSSYLVL